MSLEHFQTSSLKPLNIKHNSLSGRPKAMGMSCLPYVLGICQEYFEDNVSQEYLVYTASEYIVY